MPNVEIHIQFMAHSSGCGTVPNEGALKLERRIWELVKDLPFVGEMVVTHCDSVCRDNNCILQPFIRICCTDEKQIRELVNVLRGLADIEVLLLDEFIPKKY